MNHDGAGPGGALRVVAVSESELETASAILIEAARWLRERGDAMWLDRDLDAARLRRQYGLDDIYLASREDDAVGVIVLQSIDPVFWPDAPPGSSAFIHKLAVRRSQAGTGVGDALVAWAVETARARGARFLRLDCAADRPKLCAFYDRLGFQPVDRRWVGPYDTVFYERRL